MTRLILTALFTVLFISCTTTRTTTSKRMDIYGAGVIQMPVVVDLDVKGEKVTGTATGSKDSNFEGLKNNAISNAIEKSGADVIIEPIFKSETHGGRTTVTVTGFPATYNNFRKASESDLPLLEVGIAQKANVYEPTTVDKEKNVAGVILAILLGAGLLVGLIALASL